MSRKKHIILPDFPLPTDRSKWVFETEPPTDWLLELGAINGIYAKNGIIDMFDIVANIEPESIKEDVLSIYPSLRSRPCSTSAIEQ